MWKSPCRCVATTGNMGNTPEQLEEILAEVWDNGGNVIIPAFAVGRTQEILFHLGCLHYEGKLDHWQVFLDSPMAIAVTKTYDRWFNLLDGEDARERAEHHRRSLESFLPSLNLSESTEESMAINRIKLFREEFIVHTKIETLGGFSVHAGQNELIDWVSYFENNPRVVLVHGEAQAQDVLSQKRWDDKGIQAEIPHRGQTAAF